MQNDQFLQQLGMMLQQGGGNLQAYVQQLLAQNPQLAQQLQGQNVQQLAAQALRQRGIDPQQFFAALNARRW